MTGRRPRLLAGLVAVVVVAALVAAVAFARTGDELPVIRLGAAAGGETLAAMEADASFAADIAIWHPVNYTFELADGARVTAGEAAAWQLRAPDDLEAAANRLADRFDLGTVSPSPYGAGGFHAGADDGSGPSLWVGEDGSWYYSDYSQDMPWDCDAVAPVEPDDERELVESDASDAAAADDVEAAREPVEVDEPDLPSVDGGMDCAAPAPPENVPTADEARALAADLFADLDLPGELVMGDVNADEWGAWVGASIRVDGVPTELWVSAGWSGDARLTSFGATLAVAKKAGDYPTIDAEQAVARLQEDVWRGFGGLAGTMEGTSVEIDVAEAAPDGMDDPVSDVDAIGEPATADEPTIEPMPVEPLPTPSGEVEEVTVTLVDVESVLQLHWDVDGTVWLLPGYRFTDADGGIWQVLAIADEYLDTDEPSDTGGVPVPEPGIDEPGDGGQAPTEPGEVDPGEPVEGGGVDPEPGIVDGEAEEQLAEAQAVADRIVGLAEDEAVEAIEAAGLTPRVVARDGESFDVTADLSFSRVNLEVEDGKVVVATVG